VMVAGGGGYRLPTEAEWECACRAGTSTAWFFGDDETQLGEYGWYALANGRTQPVGGKRPNPLGLYDVYGNVWEWCHDWHARDTYAASERRDPQGPDSGTRRVLRGGAFFYNAASVRSGYRFRYPPTFRLLSVGFRVARTLE
jgi:formylglycine-generating enzyme required for sulfatase activity